MADRRIYARRLALAAAVSMLAHVLLWGGLATTRLGLLGSQPQDATTSGSKTSIRPGSNRIAA